ncbi:DMT family transporter [Sphingoaurantiacus capsulatus]|uniref:DMT family transporter n=1 Tax=Sphingoaurantiacus capsulatus TaxID=1771310 RepID=A0ABV7XB36_9SPHN
MFLLGSAILSAGPLLVRLSDVGPLSSAFWRVGLAVVPLMMLARLTASRAAPVEGAPAKAHWGWFVAAGFCFAADLSTWHLGIERTTLANAALFANSASFLYPLWGYLVARTWPSRPAAAALLLAGLGITLLMGLSADVSPRNLAGDLLCLVAAVFYTGYFVAMERARGSHSALAALGWATFVCALMLLPVALAAPGAFWPGDWTPLVLLALGSQVIGQGLIIFALPHIAPVAAGLGLLIQPLLSAAFGFVWFGERLSGLEAAGMIAILVALVLVRLPERAR